MFQAGEAIPPDPWTHNRRRMSDSVCLDPGIRGAPRSLDVPELLKGISILRFAVGFQSPLACASWFP